MNKILEAFFDICSDIVNKTENIPNKYFKNDGPLTLKILVIILQILEEKMEVLL